MKFWFTLDEFAFALTTAHKVEVNKNYIIARLKYLGVLEEDGSPAPFYSKMVEMVSVQNGEIMYSRNLIRDAFYSGHYKYNMEALTL
jgi:hypothetical protein